MPLYGSPYSNKSNENRIPAFDRSPCDWCAIVYHKIPTEISKKSTYLMFRSSLKRFLVERSFYNLDEFLMLKINLVITSKIYVFPVEFMYYLSLVPMHFFCTTKAK